MVLDLVAEIRVQVTKVGNLLECFPLEAVIALSSIAFLVFEVNPKRDGDE